ncbi:MAG: PilX N-terminal domain-containing pilus assembly protein [Gammaproteobacteria bacterium]|jgi:type IV pilus assembly protein PilX|nr:PilX N-terminal domain-containing pilus assembly protein [Gammaproteobacteria bacterium]
MCLNNQKYSHQGGFVLILALVLLAVLTLIGVSSMKSANMELKATANARQHQYAFNAAQSMIEYAISTTGIKTANLDFQSSAAVEQPVSVTIDTVVVAGSATYTGCSVGVGSSLQAGKGFSFNFFNIDAVGLNKTSTSSSIQAQGIRFPAAACD